MILPNNSKLHNLSDLKKRIAGWQLKNDSIVFTNGCFDVLHPGHIQYLKEAKALGNRLIIGLNTDNSVKRQNKGADRPINNEETRAFMLAGLHSVDGIVLFDHDTPLNLIEELKPNILVKGADYDKACTDSSNKKYIVGSKEVLSYGGKVETIAFLEGFSTTNFLERVRKIG